MSSEPGNRSSKRSDALHAEFFDAAPVGFLLTDLQDSALEANRTLLNWTGHELAGLRCRRWQDILLSIAGRVVFESHIRPLLRMQGAARGIALDLRCLPNRRLPVLATFVHHHDANGQPDGYLVTFVEAIDRQHYERELLEAKHRAEASSEELRQLADELEQRVGERTAELQGANESLDNFAHAVSHDLRAPLRAMRGFSRVLTEEYRSVLDQRGLRMLDAIDGAARNMGDLIEGLLQLALMSRGEMRIQECDLSAMAERIRRELEADTTRSVRWSIEPELKAFGDARLLEAALRNLLGNAWKYTANSRDAWIRFDCIVQEGRRIFRVADNGVGFDLAYASRLFEPFQRMHSQSEFPGLGIGLATVRKIIDRHGGTLSATAAPNQGATFSFTLPSRAEPTSAT